MAGASAPISITFRGVRGSHPMPGPTTLRYGGNTTCHEIRVGGRLVVFDAGTGVISLGDDLSKEKKPQDIALFFSHNHHDHIGGLLYFKPAYMPSTTMHIFGPAEKPGNILDALEAISSPPAHPVEFSRMGMKCTTTVIRNGDAILWAAGESAPRRLEADETPDAEDIVVRVMKNRLHPIEGVLNFRLEYRGRSYVYATDVEGDEEKGDPHLAEFASGADLLAHDGQYTSEEYRSKHRGWGHSTVGMAVKTARMAGVKRLAIIHHDPSHDDAKLDAMRDEARREFPDILFAHEGETVVIE